MITARTSEQTGYDRFVLQFDGIVPTFTVKRQLKPVFTTGASGQQVTLNVIIEIDGQEKPACVAEVVYRYYG